MKCICCGEPVNDDLLEGYCLACAAQKLKQYAILKSNLDVALEPVRDWYGEVGRPAVHVVVDIVNDLQKDRAEVLRLGERITRLNRVMAQTQDQRINITRQLGRTGKICARLRTDNNEIFEKNKKLQVRCGELRKGRASTDRQLVWISAWCEKKFGVATNDVIGKEGWPNVLVEIIAKVVDDKYQALGEQVGWYDSDTKQFCYPDEKTEFSKVSGLFPEPVFVLR